jgi:hypothetical protein
MHRTKSKKVASQNEVPAIVCRSAFGLGLLGFVIGRLALDGRPHPYHWLVALIGGLGGILVGWLWYRWRGEVFQQKMLAWEAPRDVPLTFVIGHLAHRFGGYPALRAC